MRYETRNHIGIGLLIIGGVLACFGLLFTTGVPMVITLVSGILLVLVGGYMMTRAFTDHDENHPDYESYQERVRQAEQRKRQQSRPN